MEARDGAPGANLSLDGIYHQLMELDSIERTLSDQIASVKLQLQRVKSAIDPEDRRGTWPDGSFWEIIDELEQARDKVASLHGSMRKVANASSRSRIRSLNILDLPDEVLMMIFQKARNYFFLPEEDYFPIPDMNPWEGIKNIKNIRLTCRRFCDTSSHLLLRYIDVSMRPSSLAHLEELSCHPLLSKGIQALRVHLDYFSADLATDFIHFTDLAIESLDNTLRYQRASFEREEQHSFDIPRERLGPAIEKAELISEEWSEFLDAVWDSGRDPGIIQEGIAKSKEVAGLARAHEIYRQEYLTQESVLNDGTFVQAIVTALKRMPSAKRLFVGDSFVIFNDPESHKYSKPFEQAVEDPEGLAAMEMVRAQYWDGARSEQLDDQPKEILLQLLVAVFNNELLINHLFMKLSSATDLSIPATQEQLQQLAAGTEHLRVFEFRGSKSSSRGATVDHDPEQIASFGSLISACMGGKALTLLDVGLGFALDDFAPQTPVSMGSLLESRHCPDLKSLRLTDFPLHLIQLKKFLKGLNGPLRITLTEVLLLSGTWTEALDLIRQKANWYSSVTHPQGAECDCMPEEEILAIFGKDQLLPGEDKGDANRYITGFTNENPLRNRMNTSAPL